MSEPEEEREIDGTVYALKFRLAILTEYRERLFEQRSLGRSVSESYRKVQLEMLNEVMDIIQCDKEILIRNHRKKGDKP